MAAFSQSGYSYPMKTLHHFPSRRFGAATAAMLMGCALLTGIAQSEPIPGQPPHSNPTLPEAPTPTRPAEEFGSSATTMPSRATERVLANISMLSGEAVRLSQVASQRAANSQVRSFADQVNSSSRALEQDIDGIAINKNVTVPTGKKANELAEEGDRWSRKDADDFDEDYVKRTVKIHEDAIEEIEDYLDRKDTDAEISALAQKHLPALRQNLSQAQTLRRQLD